MDKKINILGEEITIRFNMAVEIAYEEIAGKPFSLEELESQKNSVALYMAAIITNNLETSITFDRLITEARGEEITTLGAAVVDCMKDWMAIPSVVKPEQTTDSDDQPKN